jgi:outer membrane protein, multidrug efflux system
MKHLLKPLTLAVTLALNACASLSPDGYRADIATLTQGKTAGVVSTAADLAQPPSASALTTLLTPPLSAEAAIRIALLNNPNLQASLAALGVSDAERVQTSRLPNPHLSLGRLREGQVMEIERALSFNLLGLLTLPWRADYANQQLELAKLLAAQDVVRLAANTRKAWISAVAAQQSALYRQDAVEAAEASAELARRMGRVGNWSPLTQAREEAQEADARSQLMRAQALALSERERLTRLLGLDDPHAFTLPERLPDLPADLAPQADVEARALRERLDVRSAQAEAATIASSLGLTRATGVISALDVGLVRNTVFDNGAGTAKAQGLYLQSAAKVRDVAVQARSEAREAYTGWRSAYALARHNRDTVVPLRQRINDELVLRYSGMLASVWELLADTRQNILAVDSAIAAQRDFWLADTDMQTALTGTSPGGLARLSANNSNRASPQGH